MRINYTAYDGRREQDSINPDNHADIMMIAPDDDDHPFLYARVMGIFHLKAYLVTPDTIDISPTTFHVVWVRWFDLVDSGGFVKARLPRLQWAHVDDGAFDFVSPEDVLRACHLMPRTPRGGGRSDDALPGPSSVRRERDGGEDDDWDEHYVGM